MGLGDDIMFLGEAEDIYKKTGKKIKPLYGNGLNSLYDNVEFIGNDISVNARDTDKPSDIHINYYTSKKEKTLLGEKLILRPYKPKRFALRLTEEEEEKAKKVVADSEFMIVNPDYKSSFFSSNKNWGFKKFQLVVNEMSKYISVVRVMPGFGQYDEPPLKKCLNITESNVRAQAAIWKKAKFGLTFDGLMVHIMSGFNIPVVNIMGGLIDEKTMSYEGNINLFYDHPMTPCGSTWDCNHCDEANEYITTDMVIEACKKLL